MELNYNAVIKTIEANVKKLENEICEMRFEQEITTVQLRQLEFCAKMRINSILSDDEKAKEHYRIFALNLWHDLKKDSLMENRKEMTKKKNYDLVLDEITDWTPKIGVDELIDKAEKNKKKRDKKRIIATTSDGKKIIIQR